VALAVVGVRIWRIGMGLADPDRRGVVVAVVDLDAEALP